MNSTELQTLATQVRRDIVRMVHAVQSGHPGGSLGCTDLLVQLYFSTMNINPDEFDMDGKGEDIGRPKRLTTFKASQSKTKME